MIPQKQPTAWSCLPTAFAIVIDRNVNELITLIGHDGGEIISPHVSAPFQVRGFHPQEMYRILWDLGFCVTEFISSMSYVIDEWANPLELDNNLEMLKYITSNPGVICTHNHALAWDGEKIYDPRDGCSKDLDNLEKIEVFLAVTTRRMKDDLK